MITANQEKPDLTARNREIDLLNAAALRALRNAFCKQYLLTNRSFSAEQLSALLLYFAHRYLEQNNATKNNQNGEKIFARAQDLFAIVEDILPAGIRQSMPLPDRAAFQEASLFFESVASKNSSQSILFQDIANLGFAYQIFCLGDRNKETLSAMQSANKTISSQALIAFTQLYTPNWVVDFLLSNTVLPGLSAGEIPARYSPWLITQPISKNKRIDRTQLIKLSVLDPACGAGQFLFSAFDLFFHIYKQAGYSSSESVKNILSNNLYGADIDTKALWVAGLGLLCRSLTLSGKAPEQLVNLAYADQQSRGDSGFLGSIDHSWKKDHFLGQTHSVIVTNPPYLGRKCLSREIKASLKEQYPSSSVDLCAAFLERCAQMLRPGGRLGIITQASLMSIPSYHALRNYLLNNYHLEAIIRCGPGVFPLASGEKIDSVLLLVQAPQRESALTSGATISIIDLRSDKHKAQKLQDILNDTDLSDGAKKQISIIKQNNLLDNQVNNLFPGISPQLSKKLAALPKLGDIAEIRQGLATTNNARFVRLHFDVDPQLIGSLWVPYIKGAGSERFACDNPFVVKWGNNGEQIKQAVSEAYPYLKGKTAWVVKNEEFYFRPGLCFSFVNKSGLAVRRLPPGAIFDVASSAIFAKPEDEDFLLAYLNSTPISLLTKTINQTINIQVGDLKKIPILPFPQKIKNELAHLGKQAYLAKEKLLQLQYIDPKTLSQGTISSELLQKVFKQHADQQKRLIKELDDLQSAIDQKVLADPMQLSKWLDLPSPQTKEKPDYFSEQLLAIKTVAAIISALITDSKSDQHPVSLSSVSNDKFVRLFNLSPCGQNYLQERLGQSLQEFFCRTKVIDISKLAAQPSRYFSLWLKDSNSCVFFSAHALRNLQKQLELSPANSILSFWQPICAKLSKIEDWTSKDLHKTFN